MYSNGKSTIHGKSKRASKWLTMLLGKARLKALSVSTKGCLLPAQWWRWLSPFPTLWLLVPFRLSTLLGGDESFICLYTAYHNRAPKHIRAFGCYCNTDKTHHQHCLHISTPPLLYLVGDNKQTEFIQTKCQIWTSLKTWKILAQLIRDSLISSDIWQRESSTLSSRYKNQCYSLKHGSHRPLISQPCKKKKTLYHSLRELRAFSLMHAVLSVSLD